jgi:16S rRNA (uracil1498-N3)-methyltransferase
VRLTRVYLKAALSSGIVVEMPAIAAAHLSKVLRARRGDELILFTGDGREFAATVETVRGSRVWVQVAEGRHVDRESPLAVTLVQCIPRGDRMDLIVQKATELGATRIVPVLSRRSVVRLDPGQAESKATHWRAIAVNACEQCGRNRLPAIEAPRPLQTYLEDLRSARASTVVQRLLLEPESESRGAMQGMGTTVEIVIGPEGGFDAPELEAFRTSGFETVRLGPRILRTETAAIAAIAWLQSRFGDLSGSL